MNNNEYDDSIRKVVNLLKKSKSILFITGAGISADSGLPTYRGVSGLYNKKLTDENMPIEQAMAGETLYSQPQITWKYICQIEKACRKATFNKGHKAIAEMEKMFDRLWVLTQNIDGLHKAAGTKNIIDIHGDIHKLICMNCKYKKNVTDYSELNEIPPVCPQCGGVIRPKVVFFGEMLPQEKCQRLYTELRSGFDVIFSVGTSSVFPYIAMPVIEAKQLGAVAVEINPDATEVSNFAQIKIRKNAADTLEKIYAQLNN